MVNASGDPGVTPAKTDNIYNTLYWHAGGEWAEWEFTVPEDGYYQTAEVFAEL